jgi:cyclophilin family peptidyl-prolyl cis-trans isomerase
MSNIRWIMPLAVLAALACGGCPTGEPWIDGNPRAHFTTTAGDFVVELTPTLTPATVANFTQYAEDGFFDGTVFHRVVRGFVVQGGGYELGITAKAGPAAITREAGAALTNTRGRVGLARDDAGDPNSASTQFYINLADNPERDPQNGDPGYVVFGTVSAGLDVLDAMAAVPTAPTDEFPALPATDIRVRSAVVEPNADDANRPRVRFDTTAGEFVIELDLLAAPQTAAHFRNVVGQGYYTGTLFHEVRPGALVQGGGFARRLEEKETRDPIVNEARAGLSNARGTIAMARTEDPNSATSQFFFNLVDNSLLNPTLQQAGYCVFGAVVEGIDVIDAIGAVQTGPRDELRDVPLEDIIVLRVVIEPGGRVLSPAWEQYIAAYEYNFLNAGRNLLVNLLGTLIAGG